MNEDVGNLLKDFHRKAAQRFFEARDARIVKIFWVAASSGSYDFNEFLTDIGEDEFKALFPGIKPGYYEEYDDDLLSLLFDSDKYGYIAEIHIPISNNFSFKEGEEMPNGWSGGNGSHVRYIYAESQKELIELTEAKAEECFQYDIQKEKKKLQTA